MDRDRKDELPKMQVEFIDVVCKPLFTTLSESFPWIKPLLDGCLSNREKWTDLAEKVQQQQPTNPKPIADTTSLWVEINSEDFGSSVYPFFKKSYNHNRKILKPSQNKKGQKNFYIDRNFVTNNLQLVIYLVLLVDQ